MLGRIRAEAARRGVRWELLRHGARHDVHVLGGVRIPVPRHAEISDRLAEANWKGCEGVLGERWWRR